MNLTSAIKAIKKIVPKRFRKPTFLQKRNDLRALKLRILGEELSVLEEIEDKIRTKGKTSKEVSMIKSKAALNFSKKHFGINLTPEQQKRAAELMANLEQRENGVKFAKRNALEDETANKIRKELTSLFSNKEEYKKFLITYRMYNSEIKKITKQAGY